MKLRSRIFYTYTAFVAAYVIITVLPAPAKATLTKYHLDLLRLRFLDATIIILIAGMWYAIFYGYDRLNRYSQLIKQNQDGKQVSRVASGLFVFAIGLPLSSLISSAFVLIAQRHPDMTAASAIIPNYVNVIYPIVAYLFIYHGVRGLNAHTKSRPSGNVVQLVGLITITLGVVFCDLIARSHKDLATAYHLSYSMVMITLAIPYIFTWFLGLFVIAEMYEYSKHVAGIVYRKGWMRLTFGLGSIIVINILLQYLQTLSSWVNDLTLAYLLLLLYVLLFLLAGGFIVVALGTRQLMKIEEV